MPICLSCEYCNTCADLRVELARPSCPICVYCDSCLLARQFSSSCAVSQCHLPSPVSATVVPIIEYSPPIYNELNEKKLKVLLTHKGSTGNVNLPTAVYYDPNVCQLNKINYYIAMAKSIKPRIGMSKKGSQVLSDRYEFGLYIEQILNTGLDDNALFEILNFHLNLSENDINQYYDYLGLIYQFPKFINSNITFDTLKKNSGFYLEWFKTPTANSLSDVDYRSTSFWKTL